MLLPIILGSIGIIIGLYFFLFKVLIINRTAAIINPFDLSVTPPIPPDDYIKIPVVKTELTKRELRRKNLKKFVDEHNESTTDRHRHRKNLLDLLMGYDSDESEDEFVEDDNGNLVLKRNLKIKISCWKKFMSCCVKSDNSLNNMENGIIKKKKKKDKTESKDEHESEAPQYGPDGVLLTAQQIAKNKIIANKQAMLQKELDKEIKRRRALGLSDEASEIDDEITENIIVDTIGVLEEYNENFSNELEECIGLFDVDPTRKGKNIVARRKKNREIEKKEKLERGEIDVIKVNSGPPKEIIPKGYMAIKTAPRLCDADLIKQRVMVLFEGDERTNGWWCGVFSSASKKEGCNYNIKYDRVETGNMHVDGIFNMKLTLSDECAYGRQWIVIVKDPDVVIVQEKDSYGRTVSAFAPSKK